MSHPNGNPEIRQILQGIRLTLEEIRELRLESSADRKRADEDRKRADEDRKRADERLELILQDSRERFEKVVADSAKRERGLSRALAVIGKVGRDLVEGQRAIMESQQVQIQLLRDLVKAVRARNNGTGGNGR